eukprot:415141-Rhodomonas_salina.3
MRIALAACERQHDWDSEGLRLRLAVPCCQPERAGLSDADPRAQAELRLSSGRSGRRLEIRATAQADRGSRRPSESSPSPAAS